MSQAKDASIGAKGYKLNKANSSKFGPANTARLARERGDVRDANKTGPTSGVDSRER